MSRQHSSEHSRPPVRFRSILPRTAVLSALTVLAGCSSMPPQPDDTSLQREAMRGTHAPVPAPLPLNNDQGTDTTNGAVLPQVSRGSGQFVHATGLATPRPSVAGADGVTFNFENQPVQAVVKAILGDLLKKNYTIVPGVQGNISFSTSEPVDAKQALPILETLLSWTNNALVERAGSYVVLPAKDAVGGNLVPSLGGTAPAGGLQARLFPLHYIAAAEMQKLIKPFARPDAVLLVDSARNVMVMSGTPEELDNYQRTVSTFDVDWLRGMSVGVFNLQNADVDQLMPKLDEMFGSKGDTPLAGMVRFIPIKRTNALVVISTQPNYVDEVGNWIARIDQGGGNQPQLFVYDVRNMKASDLAKYLGQIYGSSSGGGSGGGEVGPGLSSGTLGSGDNARGSASGMGSTAGSFGSSNTAPGGLSSGLGGTGVGLGSTGSNGTSSNGLPGGGGVGSSSNSGSPNASSQDQEYTSQDGSISIGSVDANNQLLVRARPSQWEEIERAVKKLDILPLQVQIETKIFEVELTGDFEFGVQWYLQGLANSTPTSPASGVTGVGSTGANSIYPGAHRQIALGAGGNAYGGEPFFYSFLSSNGKFQAAIRAIESSSNTKNLSAPSLVVLNNQVAHIQSGDNIPINSTTVNPTVGTTSSYSEAQYVQTGVILDVQPRVNPGGLVYLNIHQQVSSPVAGSATAATNGNPQISQRDIATQVGVQSGQTVLLGGLIQQNDQTQNNGVPYLTRIPILGKLFGETTRSTDRTELIVLITPRVIRNSEEARQITDDYQQGFESLKPLYAAPTAKAVGTSAVPAGSTQTVPLQH